MSNTQLPLSRVLFNDNSLCEDGRLTSAAILSHERPHHQRKMRVLGSYALVCLMAGSGHYRDVNGIAAEVKAGDVLIIFPELAHRYGPRPGEVWSEVYVVFDGVIFDQLRKSTFLNDCRPILQISVSLMEQLKQLLETPRPINPAQRTAELGRFLQFLGELYEQNPHKSTFMPPDERWLPLAHRMLKTNLEQPVDWPFLARQCGMSYESFRKKFRNVTGIAPSRYRDQCRIEAACVMLIQQPQVTLRSVAHSLGFCDEYNFSKRFKQLKGRSPKEFRQTK